MVNDPLFARFFIRKFTAQLLPVVIPLIILGAVTVYITENFFGREIVTATSRQLETLRDSLDQTVFDLDALNLAFGSNTSVISAVDNLFAVSSVKFEDAHLAVMIGDLINAQINARPYVDSVYLYLDRYPDKLFTTDMGVVSVDGYPDTAWIDSYRSVPADRLLWTESRAVRRATYEAHPHSYFTMYRRLFPAVTGRAGVIVMNLDHDYMSKLIGQSALYPRQEVDLLGQSGNLILTTNADGEMSGLAKTLENTDTPLVMKRRFNSRSYYVYSAQTTRYGWRVITVIPTAGLNRVQVVIRTSILGLLAVSLIIGAALTFSVARRNARRLATVTNLFAQADSDAAPLEAPAPRNDEYDYMVETLIRTFLKQRYARLQLSERQARAENLELRTLRAQINPHFLFNTLDSLYWMTYGNHTVPSPASNMIKDLATLLRYSLEDTEEVVLANEIENGRRYMAIQQYRYADKFDVVWDIAPETLEVRVLKLMLQPLLENAIYHGVREHPDSCTITISSTLESGSTIVEVADNGLGMDKARLEGIRSSLADTSHGSEHIGLYNTNRRLRLTFGEPYGLRVESAPGGGTRVSIVLPAPVGDVRAAASLDRN